MTDIGARGSEVAVNEGLVPEGISTATSSPAVRLPRNAIGRQFTYWVAHAVVAARVVVTTPRSRHRPTQRYYHRRESFVEDAAMSREMFRL